MKVRVLGKADVKPVFRNLGKQEILKADMKKKIYQKKANKGYFFFVT